LSRDRDAFGQEMMEYYRTKEGFEIVERDDGFIDVSGSVGAYFREYKDWPAHERRSMRFAMGNVLDIGCGPGRHSLYLQKKGLHVLGIDNSPLAVEICRLRGLKRVKVMSITQVTRRLGTFDTILMMGNNFGLFGSPERARRLLRRFKGMTSSDARMIAQSHDIYNTTRKEHFEYHKMNRKRGRMAGQVRIRVRHLRCTGPWFDYLMVSKKEMEGILSGTGWRVDMFLDSGGPGYTAIIRKE